MSTRQQVIELIYVNPDDEATRFVAADWFEENGDGATAQRLREGPIKRVMDTHLADLPDHSDWGEVFATSSSGNCTDKTDPCPPGSDVDCTPPKISDVVEIIASSIEYGDYAETDCLGVFRLRDGRFLVAEGSCDTTGWD